MISITPDIFPNPNSKPVFDESIVKRALACYLPADDSAAAYEFQLEPTLNHALEFLRCASATAYELGDNLSGSQRDLAMTAVHMMEMAKTMVERSLESVERG